MRILERFHEETHVRGPTCQAICQRRTATDGYSEFSRWLVNYYHELHNQRIDISDTGQLETGEKYLLRDLVFQDKTIPSQFGNSFDISLCNAINELSLYTVVIALTINSTTLQAVLTALYIWIVKRCTLGRYFVLLVYIVP